MIAKVVRDGKVAVLISPGSGAGWFTWNADHQELLFHPKIVKMVESGRQIEITEDWVKKHLKIEIYAGGAIDLKIRWLKEGTQFKVLEHDGSESLETFEELNLITA